MPFGRAPDKIGSHDRQHDQNRSLKSLSLLLLLTCAACSKSAPLDNEEKIIRATLVLLASEGQSACVDNHTRGQPLAIFSAMTAAGPHLLKPLPWYVPGPLRPPAAMSSSDLIRDSTQGGTTHLREPENSTLPLSATEQSRLNQKAAVLGRLRDVESVSIRTSWNVKNISTGWWPINRISSRCSLNYVVSDPALSGTDGFVTVTAGHWGTIYAFERRGADWIPTAQWKSWLY
jgi:hypothetical protein